MKHSAALFLKCYLLNLALSAGVDNAITGPSVILGPFVLLWLCAARVSTDFASCLVIQDGS